MVMGRTANSLGLCCQQLRKEESRARSVNQGHSQNFILFQVAKPNLDTKGKHVLEIQDRKEEF